MNMLSNKAWYALIRPALFVLDAECAHHMTLKALKVLSPLLRGELSTRIHCAATQKIMGLSFPNRVGLAAGLDKNGEYIDALAALGWGFMEIGTVTPRPQPGNPRPRLFRMPEARAIINRMGFNNEGVQACIERVRRSQFYQDKVGILGINIGKNADTPIEKAAEDYVYCLEKVYPYADYVTANISSPNTQHLRALQEDVHLDNLLDTLKKTQACLADQHQRYVPLVIKISPDLTNNQIAYIASKLIAYQLDGVIATNTTISREAVLNAPRAKETGGLSGAPLLEKSHHVIRELRRHLGESFPIIGVGGIMSGENAKSTVQAGAQLIQLYTGLIYEGPALVKACKASLHETLFIKSV